jgi:hypothetical protein
MPKPRQREHDNDDSSYGTEDASEASPDYSNVKGAIVTDQSITARKFEFYRELDRRIAALTSEQTSTHILTNESFTEIYNFIASIKNVSAEKRIQNMKTYPNKIAYKWIKKYALLTTDTSNVLIYKQEAGAALDTCRKVSKYSLIFEVIREIHEVQAGNDHPKSRTLYNRVCVQYGKGIPRSVCEMFPMFCPICIRAHPMKKTNRRPSTYLDERHERTCSN